MPISNAHLADNVQVWDGLTYSMMQIKEAKKAARAGLVQLTANLTAADLKTADEFAGLEPAKIDKRTKAYKTRMMKAEK